MVHSEKLEETVFWHIYQGKISTNEKRSRWAKEVCRRNGIIDFVFMI